MQKQHIISISSEDSLFPSILKELAQIPDSLRILGNIDALGKKSLGVVGSRKATPYGRGVTKDLISSATKQGVVIISGLAFGVDSIAHQAALDARGQTIAVLPSGIRQIYPASHSQLAKNIVEKGGLLISEYPDTSRPMKHHFIERNRIIAALSDVLLITEAAENSGSLHTARFALELGKTVAAVPGNITSPYSKGTNSLIRTGATPILEPQDLLDLLGITKENKEATEYLPEDEIEAKIIGLLKENVSSGHELLLQSKLDTAVFQTSLTMLEIKGVIEPTGNNNWRLR